ncbi:MAG TPA: exostosin family protein [Thermoanaerobaculia bacterium]|nr:exostosin family protein [Thermoanaerobaculia bacterium]
MHSIHPRDSERFLLRQLCERRLPERFPDLHFVTQSFTPSIIENGIERTACEILRAMRRDRRSVFVILHEYATALDFGEHIVFTPHVVAGMAESFIPIAYLPYNCCDDPPPMDERPLLASFRGSAATDPTGTRQRVITALGGEADCVAEDTDRFHDWHDKAQQRANASRYRELLAASRISICPRGAGVATFRFWEALASGSVPLLVADGLRLPLARIIDWDTISLRLGESDVDQLPAFLASQSIPRLAEMAALGRRIWDEWFAPERWYAAIEEELARPRELFPSPRPCRNARNTKSSFGERAGEGQRSGRMHRQRLACGQEMQNAERRMQN